MIKTGGDTFDPGERNIYFLAANIDQVRKTESGSYRHFLLAMNDLSGTDLEVSRLKEYGARNKIFVDSGIFALTNEHKRRHGTTMDEALALPPEEVDGFGDLLEKYIEINRKIGSESWGYIELDQGGRDNKIRTRARLEDAGLNPIPVYHPLNDGWDYFDYLAERYDRICFANVVQANKPTRKRLIATAWHRHRKYPKLWIHLLGYTPDESLYALPINSGDSSTWVGSVRWSRNICRTAGKAIGALPLNFSPVLMETAAAMEMDESVRAALYKKGFQLSACMGWGAMRNWYNHIDALRREGFDTYPPLTTSEEEQYLEKRDGFYESM